MLWSGLRFAGLALLSGLLWAIGMTLWICTLLIFMGSVQPTSWLA